jgi:hypothetical protein
MASIKDRLSAIEAKLGIEPPKVTAGFFWDNDAPSDPVSGSLTDEVDGRYQVDNGSLWEHFLAFTDDEIARFKAAGITFDTED